MNVKFCYADAFRYTQRASALGVLIAFAKYRPFRPICTMRLCQRVKRSGFAWLLLPVGKIAHRIACQFACIDLPWETDIGPGFAITHGWGLVINGKAKIGRNVTIFHGATIGRGDKIMPTGERVSGYPVIGDEVWIGPNSVVVGAVSVGQGSRILPGAVVTRTVPGRSLVSGNPGEVVKTDCEPDVVNPA